jgi:hypothetical protein
MPKTMLKAPAFHKTLRSNRDVNRRTVSVTFLGDDSNEHEITFAIKCIPVTVSALVDEYGRVLSGLPSEGRPLFQPIRGASLLPAIGSDGMPALVIQFKGGGELTIEFSKAAVAEASARLTELLAAMDKGHFY